MQPILRALAPGKPLYIMGAGDITYLARWGYAMSGETLTA